jgi:hypothetical protein
MERLGFIARIRAAVRRLAGKPRRHENALPHPRRAILAPSEPIPADPAEHAEDFAIRHDKPLEVHSRRRMRELGIPDSRIGAYDCAFDFRHAACFPEERTGGENSPGARINLIRGVLNSEPLATTFGPVVSQVWEKCRLRDRIDAVIVHEDIEGLEVAQGHGFEAAHATAIARAPETSRPIIIADLGHRSVIGAEHLQGLTGAMVEAPAARSR